MAQGETAIWAVSFVQSVQPGFPERLARFDMAEWIRLRGVDFATLHVQVLHRHVGETLAVFILDFHFFAPLYSLTRIFLGFELHLTVDPVPVVEPVLEVRLFGVANRVVYALQVLAHVFEHAVAPVDLRNKTAAMFQKRNEQLRRLRFVPQWLPGRSGTRMKTLKRFELSPSALHKQQKAREGSAVPTFPQVQERGATWLNNAQKKRVAHDRPFLWNFESPSE